MPRPVPLPEVPDRRVAVRLTPDALRQVRGGHPWVFDGGIRSGGDGAVAGQLGVVFDDRRRFVAIGLWDPASPIRLRILHVGEPCAVDPAFWMEKVDAALERRRDLFAEGGPDGGTDGFRLLHGENDGLGGVVADRYGSTVVLKVYTAAWFPHLEALIDALTAGLGSRGVDVERVVLRLSRSVRALAPVGLDDGTVLRGPDVDGPVLFRERGLTFEADVIGGQKTGHFLDQRDNRVRVGALAGGGRVLDVFACTGGFSVHAAAGGAAEVTSVDLSRRSLATASANWAHNQERPEVRAARHTTVVGDAFDVLADLGRRRRRFDVVVVDPPSFAHRARDRERALDAYARLAALGLAVTEPGGRYVQSSCSSHVDPDALLAAVRAGAGDAGVGLHLDRRTEHAVDHPVGFVHGAYLATVFARRG